jgi:hypothetical protein
MSDWLTGKSRRKMNGLAKLRRSQDLEVAFWSVSRIFAPTIVGAAVI